MRRPKPILAAGLLVLVAALAACGAPQTVTETAPAIAPTVEESLPTEVPGSETGAAETGGAEPDLRVAYIPVLDVLPFFIARQNGYFAEEGITVEFVPASSALEREQLLVSGDVDGMLTDVIGPAITNAAAEPSVRIVAIARRADETAPLFRILAAPGSNVTTPADLAGVSIGISENTVIQYLADRLLRGAGLPTGDIVYESVPAIPARYNLMMEGQLGAAVLPDPLATAAMQAGAINVLDDTTLAEQKLSQSVLSFSNAVLEAKPDAIRAFLRAWYRAVEALNADPNSFRQLWLDNISVPESVQDTYEIPPFPVGEITSESVWDDVNAWLLERGIIEQPAPYAASVDASFLPE